MSEIGGTRTAPRRLTHIPFEILKQIGDQLDRHSAVQLSLTCKSLRDAGEVRVWSTLDLSNARPDDDFVTDVLEATRRTQLEEVVKLRLAALKAYPLRAEVVKELFIEPLPKNHANAEILQLVSSSIDTLVLANSDGNTKRRNLTLKSLISGASSFPRIRNFRYAIHDEESEHFWRLLSKMPSLRYLEVYFIAGMDTMSPPPNHLKLEHLSHLSLSNFDDAFELILPSLLAIALNLENLALSQYWEGGMAPAAVVSAIRNHPKLQNLTVMCDTDYGRNKLLDMGLPALQIYMDQSTTSDDEAMELDLDDMEQIPRHPGIKHYITIRGDRMSAAKYIALGFGPASDEQQEPAILRVSRYNVRALQRAPKLVDILFAEDNVDKAQPNLFRRPSSSTIDCQRAPHDWPRPYIPSTSWESSGSRGLVIRVYHNELTGDDFFHFRCLTRAQLLKRRQHRYFVDDKRSWHDFVRYKGRIIPYPVLDAVYAAMNPNESREWVEGGRMLPMTEAAWKVLDDHVTNAPLGDMDEMADQNWSDSEDDDDDVSVDPDASVLDDENVDGDEWEDYDDDGMDDYYDPDDDQGMGDYYF